jgi:hypothetical protein
MHCQVAFVVSSMAEVAALADSIWGLRYKTACRQSINISLNK